LRFDSDKWLKLIGAIAPIIRRCVFQRILAFIPPKQSNCVMDLGAGTGIAARALTTYFSRVIAVEPDPLMAKEFRKARLHATLRVMAAEEYVQSAGSIDLVNVAGACTGWMRRA
jgi:predicted RNA methylase